MGVEAFLGRTVADILSGGTLAVTLETRNIVIAQGIQFTNADMAGSEPYGVLPDALTAPVTSRTTWLQSMRQRAPLAITPTAGGFEYTNFAQGVKFVVTIVTTKDAYRTALLTPNTHVIYDGHARYGRGPCFGVLPTPGVVSRTEDWENGSNPTTTGIFRIGFPFIGVPITEVFEHGYTANLVPPTVTVKASDCDPDLRVFVSSLKAKTANEIAPPSTDNPGGLLAQMADKDPTKKWWAYKAFSDGALIWHVVLDAGWTGTVSAPSDLGATTPMCRVFCHFGCETFTHNHTILRDPAFKGWKKAGDDRFAFFTTSLSVTGTSTYWLYHLLTYPTMNTLLDWEPSITYALKQTNADLAADGATYRLI